MVRVEEDTGKQGVCGHTPHNYNTLWGRMKRAVKILFGKPIYYNDVYLNGEETFERLIEDIKRLKELKFSEGESE